MLRSFWLYAVAICCLASACSSDPAVVGGEPDAPDMDVNAPVDCANFVIQEGSAPINCDEIDKCDPQQINQRVICSFCDPRYNNVAPGECGPEPDAVVPGPGPGPDPVGQESCMSCHNNAGDGEPLYSGGGISNPHPFPGADNISCTGCHGGRGDAGGKDFAHVPPPPEIMGPNFGNNDNHLIQDQVAYFNRLTLSGIDKMTQSYSYTERPGETFTPYDYLAFINPGDLRAVDQGMGCANGQGCHGDQHGAWVKGSTIATTNGLFSATRFLVGVKNRIPGNRPENSRAADDDSDTLSDSSPRAVTNPAYVENERLTGEIGSLVEQPELAQFDGAAGGPMYNNGVYDANTLANHIIDDPAEGPINTIRSGSPLETLVDEQVNITCGDCHLYSAGNNNRYADYRSSGCTACHMEYSYDGRSRSTDRNVNKTEPLDPDNIAAPERAHVSAHQIRNIAKVNPDGSFTPGIEDRACVGCHQGSNRTVLQYWGIRLDQNQDVTNNQQYPDNPDDFTDTAQDTRLYDPSVVVNGVVQGNNTFNNREAAQYLLYEDYDADGRDDTPPDLHYEAGLGCIDCHGSRDLHGGTAGDATSGKIQSRQDQGTAVQCESCHGNAEEYAETKPCRDYNGNSRECVIDRFGNPLRHTYKDPDGHYYLISRLTSNRHYIVQTRDTVIDSNVTNPLPGQQRIIYNARASYSMGRADGNNNGTGTGPQQANYANRSFSHLDSLDCASCHASWTNNCMGCHLATEYNANPAEYFFSNITGERILLKENAADFVYQSPVMMYLGVNSRGKVTQMSPAEKVFWRYVDLNGNTSDVFAFADRLGEGNNPRVVNGLQTFPALSQNQMMPHSIRGKVTADNEGPRYCVACHITTDALDNFGAEYEDFLNNYNNQNFANINFNVLQQHIGQNPGNQLNSPFFPHMASGQGTALFLFDDEGCPVNPLDDNDNRQNCNNESPQDRFNNQVNNVAYDLDRVVEANGVSNASNSHPIQKINEAGQGFNQERAERDGARFGNKMAGSLGQATIDKLAGDPNSQYRLILDTWIDADGQPGGELQNLIINQ
jgi:hypothetical protein